MNKKYIHALLCLQSLLKAIKEFNFCPDISFNETLENIPSYMTKPLLVIMCQA